MCSCVSVIKDEKIKAARKEYRCEASEFVREHLGDWKWTFAEMRLIVKARKDNYKILKGQPYRKQFNVMDGYAYTFRCREEMHKLCVKYDLYPCDC